MDNNTTNNTSGLKAPHQSNDGYNIELAKLYQESGLLNFDKKLNKALVFQIYKSGDFDLLKKTLNKNPALVNAIDSSNNTLLHYAALDGNTELAKFLLNKGANITMENLKSRDGSSLPNYGAGFKGTSGFGNKDNDKNVINGQRAFDIALNKDNVTIANLILKQDKNSLLIGNEPQEIKNKYLWKAIKLNNPELVKAACTQGADLNCLNSKGLSPLQFACKKGQSSLVEVLLEEGANIEAKTPKRSLTPLYLAARNGHFEIVDLLIKNNANVNVATKDGNTALHACVKKGQPKCTESLISAGADINVKNNDGVLPINFAKNGSEIWNMLFKHKDFNYEAASVGRKTLNRIKSPKNNAARENAVEIFTPEQKATISNPQEETREEQKYTKLVVNENAVQRRGHNNNKYRALMIENMFKGSGESHTTRISHSRTHSFARS